jgi:hypothetical protein
VSRGYIVVESFDRVFLEKRNTESISNAIKNALESTCQVDMLKIEMVKKYSDRLSHLNLRIFPSTIPNKKPRIRSVADMNPYDFVWLERGTGTVE